MKMVVIDHIDTTYIELVEDINANSKYKMCLLSVWWWS